MFRWPLPKEFNTSTEKLRGSVLNLSKEISVYDVVSNVAKLSNKSDLSSGDWILLFPLFICYLIGEIVSKTMRFSSMVDRLFAGYSETRQSKEVNAYFEKIQKSVAKLKCLSASMLNSFHQIKDLPIVHHDMRYRVLTFINRSIDFFTAYHDLSWSVTLFIPYCYANAIVVRFIHIIMPTLEIGLYSFTIIFWHHYEEGHMSYGQVVLFASITLMIVNSFIQKYLK